jgi:hypothetical protein
MIKDVVAYAMQKMTGVLLSPGTYEEKCGR